MTRIKRKRGGQQGNQNARKHGFYSSTLNPEEICRFWNILNQERIHPEIAVLRIKLQSLVQQVESQRNTFGIQPKCTPANRRVLREVSRLIVKWSAEKYRLDWADRICLKATVVTVLERYSGVSLSNPDRSLKTTEKSKKRIKRIFTPESGDCTDDTHENDD